MYHIVTIEKIEKHIEEFYVKPMFSMILCGKKKLNRKNKNEK